MAADLDEKDIICIRVVGVLRRFIKPGDEKLSDRDLILALFDRYRKYLQEEIVDVGE